jgi:hypothetical protein
MFTIQDLNDLNEENIAKYQLIQALRRQWFAGVRGAWTEGCSLVIEPVSEEESHKCCVCHLLNCDEGQGQWTITGFWYMVNGARQKKNKPGGEYGDGAQCQHTD